MERSFEGTRSVDESSPLLTGLSTPAINEQESAGSSKTGIFSCAVICILFTELCERLTFYGINGNLVLFATEKDHLHMQPSKASILAYVWSGTCFTMPIIGGWLADSKFGKFAVIFCSAIIYLIGTLLLPLASITSDKSEHSQWAAKGILINPVFTKVVYITGLFLVAFGTGGIKANVSPFGAEQVSNRGPAAIQAFFSWFYWFINIGALLAFTFVVYIQQQKSYFYGNLIPACSLVLALIIFLIGKPSYKLCPPTGSVLETTLAIMKEAIKRSRRRRSSVSNDFVSHWLDRAKLSYGGSYSNWEVEDVKKVYRLLPIFATFILYWTVYAQMSTSMVYQGEYMDINIGGGFLIPIASLALLDTLGVLLLIPFMDKIFYPLMEKAGFQRPSQLKRIGIGMVIATASMACAGGIELVRRHNCCMMQHREGGNANGTRISQITIFYQVPQYTLVGLSEVFTSITGLELAYTEAPKSLQGVIMGVYLLTTGLGTYIGAALVAIVNAITEAVNGKEGKWYPDTDRINEGYHLAYYFFLLAFIMFLNFILYIFVALSFKVKKETANRAGVSNGAMNGGEPPPGGTARVAQDNSWSSSARVSN
ncbi:solute carrier family 15 member 4-like [Dendronephthya gigantea]|uniref:solute carrier family 15 member 4-like n=1 Tax=Dendronephthya gigantea TaxID=151771 RepID=UPI00106A60A8|nr:solute carrier family 15 member 4-like [Dendronephthya gigantea]XP_028394216.1 solute carrier family 15 member 4-like [Dendronephthya gigantea]XP_028394217.1 solute carrier family 15 member 4-like [Dendronephthya gigantea]XP_028394218.1 solute carrier family 15 member 4-like [Dendronephthya gigantea]XP_028394219.1 solute carrier family 15 member 4-like [Dendronephthya gigantea]XP_028394220.1 solute carrier family 15 member 4-like [Dendronephthya gigantea]